MPEATYYLTTLLLSIAGLGLLDWRYRLALASQPRRAGLTIAAGMGLFLVWDFIGISQGIFFRGPAPYQLPFELAPELPLEELFFLFLLCYVTLLLYIALERRWRPTS